VWVTSVVTIVLQAVLSLALLRAEMRDKLAFSASAATQSAARVV
jgi:hypothetical protein